VYPAGADLQALLAPDDCVGDLGELDGVEVGAEGGARSPISRGSRYLGSPREITVKAHRGQVMRKVRVQSLADLVRVAAALDDPLVAHA
jgi:hypothetical protein